jgi:hypothetical protein
MIIQQAMGFMTSKIILIANKLQLFTFLYDGPQPVHVIKDKFNLHERAIYDFLDSLVALGYLNREGIKDSSIYSNTRLSHTFLVEGNERYVGGILNMFNGRNYELWGNLEDNLHTGNG